MKAFDKIVELIENEKSFVLEAGAGSGKTFTLVETLKYIIEKKGSRLTKNNQKIICVTYTNVAKNEIIERIESNELVNVFTIHEFLWQSIRPYQKQLKIELCKLNEIKRHEELSKGKAESRYLSDLTSRIDNIDNITYSDSIFNDFEKGIIQHDDVIDISKLMYANYPLLTDIIVNRYPFIFVDEYQDTAPETIFCLIDCLLTRKKLSFLIGFYGDSHQKIYDYGVGDIERYYTTEGGLIEFVKKEENFRSSISVVNVLNNFRQNITQIPQTDNQGEVKFIYWRNHPLKPKKGITIFNEQNWLVKNKFYDAFVSQLSIEGWEFGNQSKDKILVLTNSRVAKRAGFGELYEIFYERFGQATKERLLDRNHLLITFFVGTIDKKTSQERKIGLEHLLDFWSQGNFNSVIRFIKRNGKLLKNGFSHGHKKQIVEAILELSRYCNSASIKDVFEFAINSGLITSQRVEDFMASLSVESKFLSEDEISRQERDRKLFDSFMKLPYSQLAFFWNHVQNNTVFSTKHGTKGDQFRNVLAVIDDVEWVQKYNFRDFANESEKDSERFLRTRNLFYVECSRAVEKLFVLCLSELDDIAVKNITSWFGENNIYDIEDYLGAKT